MGADSQLTQAKFHSLDLPYVAAIEFPAKVENIPRAIDMLGGTDAIVKAATNRGEDTLELRFRPKDRFEHPINSRVSRHHHILLRIDLPRTAWDESGADLHKALKLCKGNYKVKTENIIQSTFRFREMSDFQYTTLNSPFVNRMNETLLSGRLEYIKETQLEHDIEIRNTNDTSADIIPPPRFSQIMYPFPYGYRQNPSVSIDNGVMISTTLTQKVHPTNISFEDPVPFEPAAKLPPPEDLLKECVKELSKLFEIRPFWSRRAIEYQLSERVRASIKYAMPYVAYNYRSGPWRGVYGKYGVDPKSNPSYSKYQSEHFRTLIRGADKNDKL